MRTFSKEGLKKENLRESLAPYFVNFKGTNKKGLLYSLELVKGTFISKIKALKKLQKDAGDS